MKISVIIPIYNVENEIVRCLKSVINQDYPDIELVLVNDATPDKSFKVAAEFIKLSGYSQKTIFESHLVNLGISEARNTGIKVATGDYLFFIDSDDELANNKVLSQMMAIAGNCQGNVDLVIGGFHRVNEVGVFNSHKFTPNVYRDNESVYSAYAKDGLSGLAWGKLIRRAFLTDNNLYFEPNIYHEDLYWSFNTYLKATTVIVTELIIYNYYFRGNSITNNLGKKNVADLITVASLMYIKYQELPINYKEQTAIVVENLRRQSLTYITKFLSEKDFSIKEIKKLKAIHIPVFETKKTSLLRLNILLRLPAQYIFLYLTVKNLLFKRN